MIKIGPSALEMIKLVDAAKTVCRFWMTSFGDGSNTLRLGVFRDSGNLAGVLELTKDEAKCLADILLKFCGEAAE